MIRAVIACVWLVLLFIGSAQAFAATPAAAPEALNPYAADRLLPFWRQYVRNYEGGEAPFRPVYRLDPAPGSASARSGFWLEARDGALHPLGVDDDGYLVLPGIASTPDEVTRTSRVLHTANAPLPAIRLEIEALLPPGPGYAVPGLSALVAEMDRFQRASMGFAALMAPRFDVIVWHFDGPAPDGWHVTRDGTRHELRALGDTLYLRMTGRIARQGGEIELNATPLRVTLQAR